MSLNSQVGAGLDTSFPTGEIPPVGAGLDTSFPTGEIPPVGAGLDTSFPTGEIPSQLNPPLQLPAPTTTRPYNYPPW